MSLFVGGLSYSIGESELRKEFEVFGKLSRCEVMRSYAFVNFVKEEDAEAAINGFHS
jgi:RNA recognition motif-containing protein